MKNVKPPQKGNKQYFELGLIAQEIVEFPRILCFHYPTSCNLSLSLSTLPEKINKTLITEIAQRRI